MAAHFRLPLLIVVALGLAATASAATTAGNRAAAHHDAELLLQRVVLPSAAEKLSHAPGGAGGLLTHPWSIPGTQELVHRHTFWRVHASLDSVVAFEKAHVPRDAKLDGYSTSDGPHYPPNQGLQLTFRPFGGRISSRQVLLTIVALRGGWTVIRADAQDIWVVTRPRNEVVPAAVQEIEVDSHRITDAGKVAKIVHWFDALPIVQPGDFHCPALVAGPKIRLVFRGANDVLARASFGADTMNHSLVSTQCSPISFSIGRHQEKPLVGGRFLVRVERLLGIQRR